MDLEKAEDLATRTSYAALACQPEGNEINQYDAAAFFYEGYEYARRQVKSCDNCELRTKVVITAKEYIRRNIK